MDEKETKNNNKEEFLVESMESTTSAIKDSLSKFNVNIEDARDIVAMISLIKKRINGDKFNPYPHFPSTVRAQLFDVASKYGADNGYTVNNKVLSYISNVFLDELVEEYKKEKATDMDKIINEFNKNISKYNKEFSKSSGDIALNAFEERKESVKNAIEAAKEKGDDKSVETFTSILNSLNAAFSLDDFIEFCKTVKFKKFSFEKPSKIFNAFNFKYQDTENSISDIRECPKILETHGFSHTDSLKICFAFCKYCENMDPGNISDYTFMYYFIRNIVILDRLNYKNLSYNELDEKSKEFYDSFHNALEKCVANFK